MILRERALAFSTYIMYAFTRNTQQARTCEGYGGGTKRKVLGAAVLPCDDDVHDADDETAVPVPILLFLLYALRMIITSSGNRGMVKGIEMLYFRCVERETESANGL